MEENLNAAQLEKLKQQKLLRFRELGLPTNAGMVMDAPVESYPVQREYEQSAPILENSSQVQFDEGTSLNQNAVRQQIQEEMEKRRAAIYTAPRDKFNALESIRKGSKRQEFQTFIKAESNGSNGNQIPEAKVGKKKTRPGQSQEKSTNAVSPQNYEAKGGSLNSIESLFSDDTPSASLKSMNTLQGNLIDTDETYSNIGPSYDPISHLNSKAAEKRNNPNFSKKDRVGEVNEHQIFQPNNSDQLGKIENMMENILKKQQKEYNIENLTETIQIISQKVAEDAIKRVLKEFIESQKNKKLYEVVNKEQRVVKIEGKYYQLKPVTLKK